MQFPAVATIMAALDFALKLDETAVVNIVSRIRDLVRVRDHIDAILLPLVQPLHDWAIKNKQNMETVMRDIILAWTDRVLRPRPTPNAELATKLVALAKWTCSCGPCATTRDFLTKSKATKSTLDSIGASAEKHVAASLASHAQGLATWSATGRAKTRSLIVS